MDTGYGIRLRLKRVNMSSLSDCRSEGTRENTLICATIYSAISSAEEFIAEFKQGFVVLSLYKNAS